MWAGARWWAKEIVTRIVSEFLIEWPLLKKRWRVILLVRGRARPPAPIRATVGLADSARSGPSPAPASRGAMRRCSGSFVRQR